MICFADACKDSNLVPEEVEQEGHGKVCPVSNRDWEQRQFCKLAPDTAGGCENTHASEGAVAHKGVHSDQ